MCQEANEETKNIVKQWQIYGEGNLLPEIERSDAITMRFCSFGYAM